MDITNAFTIAISVTATIVSVASYLLSRNKTAAEVQDITAGVTGKYQKIAFDCAEKISDMEKRIQELEDKSRKDAARIAELENTVRKQETRIHELEAENKQLKGRLKSKGGWE